MIRVGIPVVIKGDTWLGGRNYFLSLLDVLNCYAPDHYHFFCLTNRSDLFPNSYSKRVEVIQCDHLTATSPRIRRLSKYFKTDIRLSYYARQLKLSVLTHAPPGVRFTPPTLYWMPDFQHCHLPHLFSQEELKSRNRLISMAAERTGHLLLSSYAAAEDFRRFFPEYESTETHVVPFSPYITPEDFKHVERSLANKVTGKSVASSEYFYLPNQFWTHKNHIVVLNALKNATTDIKVIATGHTEDHRNSEHFSNLLEFIEQNDLQNKFVIRGLVSREEVIELMAGAIAVINPSYFEGWSTTVEEAKALGKKMILSDIPVHREQCHSSAVYFDPDDANALSALLEQMYASKIESLASKYRINNKNYELSRKRFANSYVKTLDRLCEAIPYKE